QLSPRPTASYPAPFAGAQQAEIDRDHQAAYRHDDDGIGSAAAGAHIREDLLIDEKARGLGRVRRTAPRHDIDDVEDAECLDCPEHNDDEEWTEYARKNDCPESLPGIGAINLGGLKQIRRDRL